MIIIFVLITLIVIFFITVLIRTTSHKNVQINNKMPKDLG